MTDLSGYLLESLREERASSRKPPPTGKIVLANDPVAADATCVRRPFSVLPESLSPCRKQLGSVLRKIVGVRSMASREAKGIKHWLPSKKSNIAHSASNLLDLSAGPAEEE